MIVGHQKQFEYLKKLYLLNSLPHAFLFSGPERIGKRRVAVEFVKFINCLAKDFKEKPCGKCKNCIAIEHNQFPDLHLVEPRRVSSSGIARMEIKIIQIRKLKEELSLKRYQSPFKIAIIDNAHYLNKEAQSALLKILEEPKGRVLFILITHFPSSLLDTVRSRLQEIKFLAPPREEIDQFLSEKNFSLKEREKLYLLSLGKIGQIIEFIQNPDILKEHEEMLKEIDSLPRKIIAERFNFAERLMKEGRLIDFLGKIFLYLRIVLTVNVRFKEHKKINFGEFSLYPNYSLEETIRLLNSLQRIYALLLFSNVNPQIAIQNFLMEM